ncbi:Kelch repeat-containing protein [Demequina zhanjiangensis]|uniref:Kelch repeat-containing protein n=1 Tax=Demequina zhanjiangensis TaxID=3051659 RepID=A0ABT8G2W1_9MICO|nr:kelch repeat-containing protein [Demequina sp. SYSU T00b26]MDN4473492.1 kelch repeat-containing protein [Demequina sp. SYSU T00b26]
MNYSAHTYATIQDQPTGVAGPRLAKLRSRRMPVVAALAALALGFGAPALAADPASAIRINVGGPLLSATDGGSDWLADTGDLPSEMSNAPDASAVTAQTTEAVSAPAGSSAPAALFTTGRVDEAAGESMAWHLPAAEGDYAVSLHFAELDPAAQVIGGRVFDVTVEGTPLASYWDIYAAAGADAGVTLTVPVTSDGTIDIEFTPRAGAPTLAGIEALPLDGPMLSVTPANLWLPDAAVGESATTPLTLAVVGAGSVTISGYDVPEGVTIDASLPLTVAGGSTTTVDAVYTPTAEGELSGLLTFATDGDVATISVPTSGTALPAPAAEEPAGAGSGTDGSDPDSGGGEGSSAGSGAGAGSDPTSSPSASPTASGEPTASAEPTASGEPTASASPSASPSPSTEASIGSAPPAPIAPLTLALAPSVSASGIDFGDVEVGTTATDTVTLTNDESVPVTVTGVDITTPFGTDATAGLEVPALSSVDIEVSFTPTTEGAASADLTLTHDGVDSPTVVALSGTGTPAPTTSTYGIELSTLADRSASVPLDGATVTGDAFIFTTPDTDVDTVQFWLDDPSMSGSPDKSEGKAPFDYQGGPVSAASAWDSTEVFDGTHTMTVLITLDDTSASVVTATFTTANGITEPTEDDYSLLVSESSNRAAAIALDGSTLSGAAYVFTGPDTGVSGVEFWIDDPTMSGSPDKTEGAAPYDLAGGSSSAATAWNTATVADGPHTVTALVTLTGGGSTVLQAAFTVDNSDVVDPGTGGYDVRLSTSADRSGDTSLVGATVTGDAYIFTAPDDDVSSVVFWLDDPTMTGSPFKTEGKAPYDFAGSVGNGSTAVAWDSTTLLNGSHTITAQINLSSGGFAIVEAEFTVDNEGGDPNPSVYDIVYSTSSDRVDPVPLDGATVSGDVFAFTTPDDFVTMVSFWIDDPSTESAPYHSETGAPFDLAGAVGSEAVAWDSTTVPNGEHTITAELALEDGTFTFVTVTLTVDNDGGDPSTGGYDILLSTSADRSDPIPLEGANTSGDIYVFTSPDTLVSSVSFWMDDPTMTSGATRNEGKAPFDLAGGSTSAADPWDTRSMEEGPHTLTARITFVDGTSSVLTSTFSVHNAVDLCYPLDCTEYLVDTPYGLDFSEEWGGVVDSVGFGTGFTYVQPTSRGVGYMPENLFVDQLAGDLEVTTTSGLTYQSSNSLDNALGVGIDAPSQITILSTTIDGVPAGTGSYEQAGLWFGISQDDYVKVTVQSKPNGTMIEFLEENAGSRDQQVEAFQPAAVGQQVYLQLTIDPYTRTIQAAYRIGSGGLQLMSEFYVPPEYFSFDAAGIDPRIGTRSFGGILASHRNAAAPLTYRFADFAVAEADETVSAGSVAFDRSFHDISLPTAMVWGPDDRLYVTELFGTIHALTYDANWNVIDDEVIDTLGAGLTLGITTDPASTPENVILWASHSSPSINDGAANSSTVTRLSGPGFTTVEDVITGLPRAQANHAINSIHFGLDGRLYIAMGGNTGAGGANGAESEFGLRAEQPLSAALLVADVNATGFSGECATPLAEDFTDRSDPALFEIPETCDVSAFSTGLRNTYDFVPHSNGYLYGPDNGLGVTGTYPSSPTVQCTDFIAAGDVPLYNPGTQPDLLNLLEEGNYYGHPNPYRDECIFKDGTHQGVAPLENFTEPIYSFGNNRSSDGIIEYHGDAFCGALDGDLLVTNYSISDSITRLTLSEDGRTVTAGSTMLTGFNDPLPITNGPDGTFFVGEFGGGVVTVLVPQDIGCWTSEEGLPTNLLDAGGAAVNDTMYVVGGKTTSGHQNNVYAYDTVADVWSEVSPKPGSAVENPAVVALGGKVYVFGGSTLPFSGAVDESWVYDPAIDTWSALADMPTARGGVNAATTGGLIYVAGGMDGTGASIDTVEVYDPSNDTWSTVAPLTQRRDNAAMAAIGGLVYVVGGRIREASGTTFDETVSSMEVFDPSTGAWTDGPDMITGRRTLSLGTAGGKLQAIGGEVTVDGEAFSAVEEFDPATGSWRPLLSIPIPRHGGAVATVGGEVHVVGGGVTGGASFSAIHSVFRYEAGA